jgi:DNA-binding NarL/FixJ family response regulator
MNWQGRMKFLVVDDHALIRDALRGVLAALRADVSVLEAWSSSRALGIVDVNTDIDLVLLDLGLPDASGFDTLAQLRQRHPEIAVVVLSASQKKEDITRALQLGAQGLIPKSAPREVMLGALEFIFAGGIYIPPEILASDALSPAQAEDPERALPPPQDLGLTARQREVLALMMQGKSNKAICRSLVVAEPTVKNHVTAILKALNAANRTQAVVAAGALLARSDRDAS